MPAEPGTGRRAGRSGTTRPLCRTCGKRIYVPAGWSTGAAVRRHYWRHHRDAMTRGKR